MLPSVNGWTGQTKAGQGEGEEEEVGEEDPEQKGSQESSDSEVPATVDTTEEPKRGKQIDSYQPTLLYQP